MSLGHKCCISFSLLRFKAMFCLSAFLSSFVLEWEPECLWVVCVRLCVCARLCVSLGKMLSTKPSFPEKRNSADMHPLDSLPPNLPHVRLSLYISLVCHPFFPAPFFIGLTDSVQSDLIFYVKRCSVLGIVRHGLVSGWDTPDGMEFGTGWKLTCLWVSSSFTNPHFRIKLKI